MRWLIDNNVPRAVTWLLRDRGHDVVEVRDVLGPAVTCTDRGSARIGARYW